MVIYVAAPYVCKTEAKRARHILRVAGFTVNSRWLDFEPPEGMTEPTPAILHDEAANDVADILNANALVVLNLQKSEGKAWEQGFAYGLGLPIIAVGRPENCVFHHLDHYEWVPDVSGAIDALRRL
jgi:nucleoside 2-deoxyribosyltransferase